MEKRSIVMGFAIKAACLMLAAVFMSVGIKAAANSAEFSLVKSNSQWRLRCQLPQTNGSYQVLASPKIDQLMKSSELLLEWDAQEIGRMHPLSDFVRHSARFFGVRHVPMFTNAAPVLFELPANAPFLFSHPLIYDGRLYIHHGNPMQAGKQYLSCHDLRLDRKLLWSASLGDDLFYVDLMDRISWNLMRSDDVIPLVVYTINQKQRFLLIDAVNGEIKINKEIGARWPYVDSHGKLQNGSVNRPTGNMVEHGDEILLPNGTMICKCSGEVEWSNSGWILFGKDAVIIRDAAFGFDSGASLRIKAMDLSQARNELTGFAEPGAATLFGTDPDSHYANTYSTDHFLVSQSRLYKGRSYTTAMGGPDPGQYLEEFSATNGVFLRRARVLHPTNALDIINWKNPLVTGYMQASGSRVLMPFSGQISGVGDGKAGRIYAFDMESMTQAWSFTHAGQHTHAVPTKDNVIVVEELYDPATYKYKGFRLLKVDMLAGTLKETYENAVYSQRDDYRPSSVIGKDTSGQTFLCSEKQPLLYQGSLFLPVQGEKGSAFWIINVNDSSANVLQYKFNNQLNPVLNLAKPGSNQDSDAIPPIQVASENSTQDQTGFFAPVSASDQSVDKPAQAQPVASILTSLGLIAASLDQMERGYVAMLAEVKFSNNGEDAMGNVGEGYLRLRTLFGCEKAAMRYPWKGFLGLYYEPPSVFNGNTAGPDFRTYAPNMPLFYRPTYDLANANSSLYLSYSALEDDNYDTFGKIELYLKKAAQITLSYLAGDYCGIAAIAAKTAAQEANDYTQSFGAPFLTIFNGATDAIPNQYGIQTNASQNEFRIAASATRGVMVSAAAAVNAACSISDLANGEVSALDNVVHSALDVFDDREQSTKGVIRVHSPLLLRVKSLSVTLNRVDLDNPGAQTTISARIGLLGEDSISTTLAGAVNPYETPFRSYVKRESVVIQPNSPITNTLYSATMSLTTTSHGSVGVFAELDVATMEMPFRSGSAVYSETRFFQDILYGAWEPDPKNAKRFTKTVKKPLNSRTLQGYATLTYVVLLDP